MKKLFDEKHLIDTFHAQVFMCEHPYMFNNFRYWRLRLLSNGQLIEAYQLNRLGGRPRTEYMAGDELLITGRWSNNKTCLQIMASEPVPEVANEPFFYGEQLKLDFGV